MNILIEASTSRHIFTEILKYASLHLFPLIFCLPFKHQWCEDSLDQDAVVPCNFLQMSTKAFKQLFRGFAIFLYPFLFSEPTKAKNVDYYADAPAKQVAVVLWAHKEFYWLFDRLRSQRPQEIPHCTTKDKFLVFITSSAGNLVESLQSRSIKNEKFPYELTGRALT